MFEKILSITNNYAIVKISNNFNNDILNYNVIFEDTNKKVLGEIIEVFNGEAKISFLGEYIDNKFFSGIVRKPTTNSLVRIINQQELGELVSFNDNKTIPLGFSPLYNNYPIKVNIDDMFCNNMAILGNAGFGKTYCVARIIQNFFSMKDKFPFNSNIFIFSSTSEYYTAFNDLNKINSNFNYKLYNNDKDDVTGNRIKLPLWLLSIEDYANLLDVTDYFQISIIEKMLNYVSIFAKNDNESTKYKNHLIAKALIRVLYSNQINSKIREQIFEILTNCYTKELNLDVEVPGIGYTKKFRKCFDIDKNGEFLERTIVTKYIQSFIDNNTKWNEEFVPTYFNLNQLENALDFALISEGVLLNDNSYKEAISLKVKLHSLNKSSNREFFDVANFITMEQFINSLLVVNNKARAQIVNFVLEDFDSKFAKILVKILCRILFKFTKKMYPRGAMPIHIILEDADRYVQNDNDTKILGYNIFDRIAKEGRKFGMVMNLISNIPSKIDNNVLSQCSNFMIFKLNHPCDLEYIKNFIPNINEDIIEKQKSLQVGTCVTFGKIMKIPMLVKMDLPYPEPKIECLSIYDKWIVDFNK